jgi:cbb3-type cytochrome oxidase subunit 3
MRNFKFKTFFFLIFSLIKIVYHQFEACKKEAINNKKYIPMNHFNSKSSSLLITKKYLTYLLTLIK